MDESWHFTEIRVRYSETDAMGLLHHANFISYFEVARTELFRANGGDYRLMEARDFFFVVVKVECEYKSPARYDEVLSVGARIANLTPVKLEHEYRISRGDVLIAKGRSTLACVNGEGNIQRITGAILYGADPDD